MNRGLLALALLLVAPVAAADPITSAILVATAGTAFEAVALYAVIAANALVVNFALGKATSLLMGNKSGSSAPSSQTVTVRASTGPREIVYGETRKSGVMLHQAASGNNNKYLWYVLAIAGHQVDDMTDVWLGTDKILDANINTSTGAVTQAPFTGKLNIWRMLGSDAQAVQADWDSAFADVTTNHRGRGMALLIVRMERDSDAYPNGAPQNIFVTVRGKRVYDPRKDSTNGGSGSHRLNDATTWEWSDNSALCTADYITGGSMVFDVATPNNRLGMRSDRVNWDRVITAANKCDELVAIPGSTTEKRYRTSLVLSCADPHGTNLDRLLTPMHGNRVFSAGAYQIYAGQFDTPTETISDTDLAQEGYKVTGALSQPEVYNQVCGTYFDPARDYQEQTSYVRRDAAFETADGKAILRTVTLDGVPGEYQAQRISEIIKQESRNQISVELNLKLSALRVAPWDTFYLQLRELAAGDSSWNAKVMRATVMELDLQVSRVRITAREESATAYADLLGSEYSTAGSASAARQMETPDPASGLTATSVPGGIRFAVTLPGYVGPNVVVELYEHTSSTPFSSATRVAEFQGPLFTLDRWDTTTRYYWVKLFDKRSKQRSEEYPTAAAGVSGVAERATNIVHATHTGPTNVYDSTGSTSTQLMSVSVPAQPVDCEIVVTAQGHIDHTAGTGTQGSTCAMITDVSFTTSIMSIDATIARNVNTSDLNMRQTFSLERRFQVSAGVAKTYYLNAQGMAFSAPGSVCNISNVMMKAEVIKL